MCTFEELKQNKDTFKNNLLKELEKNSQKYYDDESEKYWRLTADKSGNGAAIIRFLPAPEGENLPFVKVYNHSFQNPDNGKWYIESCPSTVGRTDCPICKANNELWNTGSIENQNIVRLRKRKLTYISNILVVNDPAKPENNGRVFLFRYGKSIFDMIQKALAPDPDPFEVKQPVNVFDFWEGMNFKLKMAKVEGYPNYKNSEWIQGALGTDEEIKSIWQSEYKLLPLVANDQFKSKEELTKKFSYVMGQSTYDNMSDEDVFAKLKPSNDVELVKQESIKQEEKEKDDIALDLDYLSSLVD